MKTVICATLAALFVSLTGTVSSNAFAQFPEPQSAYKLEQVIITSYGFEEIKWTFDTPATDFVFHNITRSKGGSSRETDTGLMKGDGPGPFRNDQDSPAQELTLGYSKVEWTFMTLLELGFTGEEAAWLADSYGN